MVLGEASVRVKRVANMLTKKSKYALKAMIYLAAAEPDRPVLIRQLAREEKLPKKFLERILLDLKTAGLLVSRKGKGGGYMLGKPAHQISIGEVLRLTEGALAPVPCVSKLAYRRCADCPNEAACLVRPIMKEMRDSMAYILDTTTLADAVSRAATSGKAFDGFTYTI